MLTDEQLAGKYIKYSPEITEEIFDKILERAKSIENTKPYDCFENTFEQFKLQKYFWFKDRGFWGDNMSSWEVDNNSQNCTEIQLSDIIDMPRKSLSKGELITGNAYTFMENNLPTDEELLEYAYKHYTEGKSFISSIDDKEMERKIIPFSSGSKITWHIHISIENMRYVRSKDGIYNRLNGCSNPAIYSDKTGWCKLSEKEEMNTYGLHVGDKLPEEVICKWSDEGLNYCGISEKWGKKISGFEGNRYIISFKELDGVVGFEVSGTANVYLRAEGFKEFKENFNKPKEVPKPDFVTRFKIGDKIRVLSRPSQYSSGKSEWNAKYPLDKVTYPYEFIVKGYDYEEGDDFISLFDGKYGWCYQESYKDLFEHVKENDFIVGKWYKFTADYLKKEMFAKYSNKQDVSGRFYHDEFIENGDYSKKHDWSTLSCNPILLEDLSEIQQFLPEGHPDKFIESNKTHSLSIGSKWMYRHEKVKILAIDTETPEVYLISREDNAGWVFKGCYRQEYYSPQLPNDAKVWWVKKEELTPIKQVDNHETWGHVDIDHNDLRQVFSWGRQGSVIVDNGTSQSYTFGIDPVKEYLKTPKESFKIKMFNVKKI